MIVKEITLEDDLDRLVSEINGASWDSANEISDYDAGSLRDYLKRQDTIFITCHENLDKDTVLLGIASSRIEMKPYGRELWLYVDEVDVCADQRQKGAGKRIMQTLIAMAEARGCEEVWLGAEANNGPANALYRSLDPDEVSNVTGYTYETDE
ncbi:MAG: GNAT family N-acetyltransferase [Halioglobus sp.]|nr:GNAT family N-acetyltransferase [Halioglobus sp.]